MDAILFYGEGSRSDASRRQVRSAAAQHSHRIGPRKPKSSKKPKSHSDAGHQKKRSLKANTLSTTTNTTTTTPASSPILPTATATATASATATATAIDLAGQLAVAPATVYSYPPSQQASPIQSLFSAHRLPAQPASVHDAAQVVTVPSQVDVSTPREEGVVTAGREKDLKRQAAQARFHEIQAIQRQFEVQAEQEMQQARVHQQTQQQQAQQPTHPATPGHVYTTSSKLPPLQMPGASPLAIERIEHSQPDSTPSVHSRNDSQASPLSPSTRLPQYSWTEYPRYGLGHNHLQSSLQMLAQVAVAEREASETQEPPALEPHDVPGFRQFSANAQQPG